MSKANNLTDFVALITGSSSGIGAAAAIEFAKCGACVVITSFDKENLDSVASEIIKISPKGENGVLQVVADITIDDDCKRLINETIEHYGKLDILVNNAGIGTPGSVCDANIMEIYDKIMNTNLRPAVLLSHLAVPYLEVTKGVIIYTSSFGSLLPVPEMTPYCMLKSSIDMLTKCMALELGPKGIRVNSVNPGVIKTNILTPQGVPQHIQDEIFENATKFNPLRRFGVPIDIANVMVFLASDESSFITGTNLLADGGGLWGPRSELKI